MILTTQKNCTPENLPTIVAHHLEICRPEKIAVNRVDRQEKFPWVRKNIVQEDLLLRKKLIIKNNLLPSKKVVA